jgi:hypothetical protein
MQAHEIKRQEVASSEAGCPVVSSTTIESRRVEPDAIYSVKTAALLLDLHEVTLRKKLRAGIVRGSRKLGDWRVRGAELLRLA